MCHGGKLSKFASFVLVSYILVTENACDFILTFQSVTPKMFESREMVMVGLACHLMLVSCLPLFTFERLSKQVEKSNHFLFVVFLWISQHWRLWNLWGCHHACKWVSIHSVVFCAHLQPANTASKTEASIQRAVSSLTEFLSKGVEFLISLVGDREENCFSLGTCSAYWCIKFTVKSMFSLIIWPP